MQRGKWLLISLVTLSLMLGSSLAFAGGQGQAKGNNSPNQAVSQQSGQGQWNNNQSPGQSSRGHHHGWQKQGSARGSGVNKNSNANCPKGSKKQG
jgi:hypothetical protein